MLKFLTQMFIYLPSVLAQLTSSIFLPLPVALTLPEGLYRGFLTRMMYLYCIIMLVIHHSGWEPSICVYVICDSVNVCV